MPSKRRYNHGGGQIWRIGERPAPPRFVVSVAQVAWEATVTDTESGEIVHTTERHPRELDAKVAAGLWIHDQCEVRNAG